MEEAKASAAGTQIVEGRGQNSELLDDERWEALTPVPGWASFPTTETVEVGQGDAPRPPSQPCPPCTVGLDPLGGHGGLGRDGPEARAFGEYRHQMDDEE
eukprot:5031394-Pyramimonas_sp.AAC.1